jgi:hypothetical protein
MLTSYARTAFSVGGHAEFTAAGGFFGSKFVSPQRVARGDLARGR